MDKNITSAKFIKNFWKFMKFMLPTFKWSMNTFHDIVIAFIKIGLLMYGFFKWMYLILWVAWWSIVLFFGLNWIIIPPMGIPIIKYSFNKLCKFKDIWGWIFNGDMEFIME